MKKGSGMMGMYSDSGGSGKLPLAFSSANATDYSTGDN